MDNFTLELDYNDAKQIIELTGIDQVDVSGGKI